MQSAGAQGKFVGCEVRRQLAEQFAITARLYAEAVATLTSRSDLSQAEYRELIERASEARLHAGEAQAAFEEHVASHGCEVLLAKSQQV